MANQSDINLGNDVQVIREILFGEQLQSIQDHIHNLEDKISNLQKENQKLQAALEAEAKTREQDIKTSEGTLDTATKQLERQLKTIEEEINTLIDKTVQDQGKALKDLDRKSVKLLNQLQAEIAEQMTEHQKLHDGLVTALASALLQYTQGPDTADEAD
jgi:chromosome segregation ATPase